MRRNPGQTPRLEIKLQKGVDPTPAHPYMALHRRGADAMPARHRSPIQAGQSSPYHKSGSDGCPPLLLDGSLTSLVEMKGHVGDGARSGGFKAPDTG